MSIKEWLQDSKPGVKDMIDSWGFKFLGVGGDGGVSLAEEVVAGGAETS